MKITQYGIITALFLSGCAQQYDYSQRQYYGDIEIPESTQTTVFLKTAIEKCKQTENCEFADTDHANGDYLLDVNFSQEHISFTYNKTLNTVHYILPARDNYPLENDIRGYMQQLRETGAIFKNRKITKTTCPINPFSVCERANEDAVFELVARDFLPTEKTKFDGFEQQEN